MSNDEFTKLFKYMQEFRADVNERFAKQEIRFDRLETMIQEVLKKQEISDEERLVMGHQLDRLNRWVQELADKIGYKLSA